MLSDGRTGVWVCEGTVPLYPPSQTDLVVVVVVAVSSTLGLEYRVIMYRVIQSNTERERSGLLLSTDGVPFAPTFLSRERPPAVCLCEFCVRAAPEIVSDCFDFDSTHLCVFLFFGLKSCSYERRSVLFGDQSTFPQFSTKKYPVRSSSR